MEIYLWFFVLYCASFVFGIGLTKWYYDDSRFPDAAVVSDGGSGHSSVSVDDNEARQ